jgi:hypothetical protein
MSYIDTKLYTKRPEDRLDFDVDFARRGWLTDGDTIQSVLNVEVSEGGVEIDGHDFTSTAVKVWLKGGTVGETVHVTVEIATVQGREKEVCFKVRVRGGC